MADKEQTKPKMDRAQAEKILEQWIGFLIWHVQTYHSQQELQELIEAYGCIKNG